jgi:hypothetical protein
MSTALSQANRVLLHNLSWQQFENLLLDLGDSRAATGNPRMDDRASVI